MQYARQGVQFLSLDVDAKEIKEWQIYFVFHIEHIHVVQWRCKGVTRSEC